jgi:hypothetical protein
MRVHTLGQRAGRLVAVLSLTLSFVPFDAGTAEAKRIKVRTGSHVTERNDVKFQVRPGPASANASKPDQPSRMPGAAAAAAERARAALAAEGAQRAPLVVTLPAAGSESDRSGTVCVAGC